MKVSKLSNNIVMKVLMKWSAAFLCSVLIVFSSSVKSQEVTENLGVKVVVIDAGHGGKDGGCVGSHALEKNIALSIALKTGKYIEENIKDVKVIYTRTTDVFVELHERAKIANRAKADLFISIHVDGFTNSTPKGTSSYVMGLAKSESNLRAAMRENEAILMEDNYEEKYENFDPNSPESYIAMSLQQSAFLNQSLEIAARIQDQFRERVGRVDRGVKQGPFLVLNQTTMPSVLVETGFISHPEDQKFLAADEGQEYMASAIYRAFKDYKQSIEEKLLSSFQMADDLKKQQQNSQKKGIEGLVFKVQLATSATKIDLVPGNFKGLKEVEVYEAGGLFRYTYGQKATAEEAITAQEEARAAGYKDAFIVAFLNGNRISVGEANKLLSEAL